MNRFRNKKTRPARDRARAQPPGLPPPLLDEAEAARFLSLTRRTLQAWRLRGLGPPHVRISRRAIRYRVEDLVTYVEGRVRSSTTEPD